MGSGESGQRCPEQPDIYNLQSQILHPTLPCSQAFTGSPQPPTLPTGSPGQEFKRVGTREPGSLGLGPFFACSQLQLHRGKAAWADFINSCFCSLSSTLVPAAPANRFVLAQLKGQGIPWLFSILVTRLVFMVLRKIHLICYRFVTFCLPETTPRASTSIKVFFLSHRTSPKRIVALLRNAQVVLLSTLRTKATLTIIRLPPNKVLSCTKRC